MREEVCKERVWMGGGVPKGPKQQETPRHRPHAQQTPICKSSNCPKVGWPSSGSQAGLPSSEAFAEHPTRNCPPSGMYQGQGPNSSLQNPEARAGSVSGRSPKGSIVIHEARPVARR